MQKFVGYMEKWEIETYLTATEARVTEVMYSFEKVNSPRSEVTAIRVHLTELQLTGKLPH